MSVKHVRIVPGLTKGRSKKTGSRFKGRKNVIGEASLPTDGFAPKKDKVGLVTLNLICPAFLAGQRDGKNRRTESHAPVG